MGDDRGGIQLTGSIGSDLQGPAGQRRKRRRKNHCSFFLPGGVKAYDGGHSHEDRFASAPAARTDSAKAKDDVAGASSSPSMGGGSGEDVSFVEPDGLTSRRLLVRYVCTRMQRP